MFLFKSWQFSKAVSKKAVLVSLFLAPILVLVGMLHLAPIAPAAIAPADAGMAQAIFAQETNTPSLVPAPAQSAPASPAIAPPEIPVSDTALLFQNDRYAVRIYKEGAQAYVNVYNKEAQTQPLDKVPVSITPASNPEKDPTKYLARIGDQEYIVSISPLGASNLTIFKGGTIIYNQGGQQVEIARKVTGISDYSQPVNSNRELVKTIFANAAKLTLFTLMLSFGLRWTFANVIWLWKHPALLVRSLIAVLIVVPVFGLFAALIPGLTVAERIGIGVMIACPGAPMIPFKSLRVGGQANYVASLQFTICILAIISVPLTAVILAQFFPNTISLAPLTISKQIFFAQVLPMGIGVVLKQYFAKVADDLVKPVGKIANILLLLLLVALLLIVFDKVINAGLPAYLAMALIAIASLICGHVLGGPQPNTRTTLAYATVTRNAGLAFLLVTLNFPDLDFVKGGIINTLVTYALVAAILSIPYTAWRKRTLIAPTQEPVEPEVP